MYSRRTSRRNFLQLFASVGIVSVLAAIGCSAPPQERPQSSLTWSPQESKIGAPSLADQAAATVLLLTNNLSSNPFGNYLSEILLAEGLNLFQTADIGVVDRALLSRFPVAILAEGPLDAGQVQLLQGYVSEGGHLVAMRPDAQLASLLGVERVAGAISEGYMLVDVGKPVGRGIAAETLQFHGEADNYRLAGAEAIAWLYENANTPAALPAVTLRRYGRGTAVMWAFDLARSVAYTRQGNPKQVKQDRDGLDDLAAVDMFVGWVDLQRIATPQADELQRLLANLLTASSEDEYPLPRLWYLPAGVDGMLVATGDSHANPAWMIEDLLKRVEQRGGHISIYYTTPALSSNPFRRVGSRARRFASDLPFVGPLVTNPNAAPRAAQVSEWRSRGHEFGIHPYVEEGVEEGYRWQIELFNDIGYGPISPTVRTHRVLWKGWVETARVQAALGLRMNLDYYHSSPALRDANGRWVYGYFTGSALPMKFVDEKGIILNIYQQPTQLVDEHLLTIWSWGPNLKSTEAVAVSQEVIGRSVDRGFGPIAAQFHADTYNPANKHYSDWTGWADGTLDYAVARGIPIWSAERWLAFVEARHDAEFGNVRWDGLEGRLTFQIRSGVPSDANLGVMLPISYRGAELFQVLVDGTPTESRKRTVGGVTYASVPVSAGLHQLAATYVPAR